jgi:hypothetical protein
MYTLMSRLERNKHEVKSSTKSEFTVYEDERGCGRTFKEFLTV